MSARKLSVLPELIKRQEKQILADWLDELSASGIRRADAGRDGSLDDQCRAFLKLVQEAAQSGAVDNIQGSAWSPVRDFLTDFSRSRVQQGFTPTQTATFIFSLKKPLFTLLRAELSKDAGALADETWAATELLDSLGLHTTEAFQRMREDVIRRQQQELLELSTPVVKLWDGVLALPMIGTLDSARTQVVMESLLQRILETGAGMAIIDITGVPTVDTLVAQHLLKTVTAARLMGADCIISGIRPQIAQTIVHLGVDLEDVMTKASLADAFAVALQRTGYAVRRRTE